MKMEKEENENSIKLELLDNSKDNEIDSKENRDKLYGNDISIKKPKKLGKLRTLLYIKDYPLIAIGANSKQIN